MDGWIYRGREGQREGLREGAIEEWIDGTDGRREGWMNVFID